MLGMQKNIVRLSAHLMGVCGVANGEAKSDRMTFAVKVNGGLTMSLGDLAALLWIGAWFAVLWRLRYYDGMLDQLLQELREELIGKK